MQSFRRVLSTILACTLIGTAAASDTGPSVTNAQVVPLTRFLEQQPLNKDAPVVRSALLDWEDKSTDVVDVVCPGVFSPLPDKSLKYNGELLVQFIFGSAAYQIANPAEKGKLMPAQLAGMVSMIKAYRSIVALEPNARIPRFDELSKDDEQGSLAQVIEPLVAANCKPSADTITGGLPPWHFQMTPQDVASISSYGPYNTFHNGDLETYAGFFNGHRENVQFFFQDGKLTRIGIFLYEGPDAKAAATTMAQTYATLTTQFGNLSMQGIEINSTGQTPSSDAMAAAAINALQAGKEVRFVPLNQPKDKQVFASLRGDTIQGQLSYAAIIFYDAPHD